MESIRKETNTTLVKVEERQQKVWGLSSNGDNQTRKSTRSIETFQGELDVVSLVDRRVENWRVQRSVSYATSSPSLRYPKDFEEFNTQRAMNFKRVAMHIIKVSSRRFVCPIFSLHLLWVDKNRFRSSRRPKSRCINVSYLITVWALIWS